MNVFFAAASLILCCISSGKPVSEDLDYVQKVFSTHYGKYVDFKDVKIPEKQDLTDSRNEHPYEFILANDGSGNYSYQFDTFELKRSEVGELKSVGTDHEVQVVRGQYTERYVNKDGVHVIRTVGYIADENGYRPFFISIAFVLSQAQAPPGGPRPGTKEISGATLESLIGGNTLG